MSSQQTEKSNYPSIYSPGKFITFPQYLAELMCGRKGKSEKTDLPAQFWESSKKWSNYFKMQLTFARRLMKKYSEAAILAAVKEMNWVYSLQLHALEKRMKEIDELGTATKQATDIKPAEEASKGRFNRKSKLSKLDE